MTDTATLRPGQARFAAIRVDAYWCVIDRMDATNRSGYTRLKKDAVEDAVYANRRWRQRREVTKL